MNENIRRLADLFNTEDLYFSMYYVTSGFKERLLVPLKEENTGGDKFLEYVEKARKYGAREIIVRAYAKADKKFRKRPEFEETVSLEPKQNLSGLSGLEVFGGLTGLIEQKVGLETLRTQVSTLKEQLEEAKRWKNTLESENQNFKKENEELRYKIRELEWEIKQLEREYQLNIEEIKQKNKNLDRIIEVGGSVLIKAAGIDKKTLRGLLGIEESKQLEEHREEIKEAKEVKVSLNTIDTAKQPAYDILNEITVLIERNIQGNSPQDAMRYVQSLQAVVNYLHTSEANFNSVLDFIRQRYTEPEVEAGVYQD